MKGFLCGLVFLLLLSPASSAREFTVVAYNVENLFDLDGISLFGDYLGEEAGGRYNRAMLRTKLETIGRVLQSIEGGRGPDVILFQEFEADFTPDSAVRDYAAFLEHCRDVSVAEMLGPKWRPSYAGIPSEAWLLKQLSDLGMGGYEVAVARAKPKETGIAHSNAVFTRFPVRDVRIHEMPEARDLLEVHLMVAGHELILFCNHWKSGASDPESEATRVKNARVLRKRIDAILADNPYADIVVGGDLNAHYNQPLLYPEIKTGIGDVLRSQGDEAALQKTGGPDLYNLWFELPPESRFSEIWRGRKGTLMHLILSRGLYDDYGVAYIDGSFRTLTVPGVNADGLGRPIRWTFAGRSGGGASDHLPLIATFRTAGGTRPGLFAPLEHPSRGDDAPDVEYWFDYSGAASAELPGMRELADAIGQGETGRVIGRLFSFEGRLIRNDPMEIEVLERRYPVYVPARSLYRLVKELPQGRSYQMIGELNVWNGELQWILHGVQE